jgi:hypothetical protein
VRIVAEDPGELVFLTVRDLPPAAPGSDRTLLPSQAFGLARIEIRR